MDPATLAAAVTTIVGIVDWKEVAKKLAGDAATDAAKAGRRNLLQRLQPDTSQKAAKQAVELFTEEFVKELDDKCPLGVCRNETQASGCGVGLGATPPPCFIAQSTK